MEIFDKYVLYAHITAGTISLFLFWIPVVVKKGSKYHNLFGRWYTDMMWFVILSSFVLSINNFYFGHYIPAAFLGFLGVLTAIPLWYANVVLKKQKVISLRLLRTKRNLYKLQFFFALTLIVWAIILNFKGFAILMLVFGAIGMTGYKEAFGDLELARNNHNWLRDHLTGMMTSGIAAYTAFFAFGGGAFLGAYLKGPLMAIPWILPSIIGTFIIIRMKNKYVGPKKI